MANYHFKLKTDKKKDGTRVRATNHVTYINREGKYKDIDERGIGSLAYADTLTGVRHIEHLPDRETLLYKSPYGTIKQDKTGIHISKNASVETVAIALSVARNVYGDNLTVRGDKKFFAKALLAGRDMNVPPCFSASMNKTLKRMKEETIDDDQRDTRFHRTDLGGNRAGNRQDRERAETIWKPDAEGNTIESLARRGLSLPTLSSGGVARPHGRRRQPGTTVLVSSAERLQLHRARAEANRTVRRHLFQTQIGRIQDTTEEIMKQMHGQLDKTFAESHVQYINREAAFKERGGCVFTAHHLPPWAEDSPLKFWKEADDKERANGERYKEIEFCLPNELTLDQQREIIDAFLDRYMQNFYYAYAVHDKIGVLSNGEHHPHVHLMFSTRELDAREKESPRSTPEEFFRGVNRCKKAECWTGTWGQRRGHLRRMRETFAEIQNEILEKYGHPERVDHRSLKARREEALANGNTILAALLDRLPTTPLAMDALHGGEAVEQHQRRKALNRERELSICAKAIAETCDKKRTMIEKYEAAKKEDTRLRGIIDEELNEEERAILADDLRQMDEAKRKLQLRLDLAVWHEDALEQSKLDFMSLEEREVWQELKTKGNEIKHWEDFLRTISEPSVNQPEEQEAYQAVRREIKREIKRLDESIRKAAKTMKPVHRRLSSKVMQKKVQEHAQQILFDDKLAKRNLDDSLISYQKAVQTLHDDLDREAKTRPIEGATYRLPELSAALDERRRELTAMLKKKRTELRRLKTRVISYNRAVEMAKNVYVKGGYKKLRDDATKLRKQETYLINDKKKWEQEWAAAKGNPEKQKALLPEQESLDKRSKTINNERQKIERRERDLNARCEYPKAREKIESIAAGILRKNQPTVQQYQTLQIEVKTLAEALNEITSQITAVNHQEKRDTAMSGEKGARYRVAPQPGVMPSIRQDAAAVAKALRGDSHYTQLVARSKPDHLDDWEMLSEMEKDERLEEMESRQGW